MCEDQITSGSGGRGRVGIKVFDQGKSVVVDISGCLVAQNVGGP